MRRSWNTLKVRYCVYKLKRLVQFEGIKAGIDCPVTNSLELDWLVLALEQFKARLDNSLFVQVSLNLAICVKQIVIQTCRFQSSVHTSIDLDFLQLMEHVYGGLRLSS